MDASSPLGLLFRLARLAKSHWRAMARVAGLTVSISLLALPAPYFTKLLVDSVYPAGSTGLLAVVLAASFVVTMFASLVTFVRSYLSAVLMARLNAEIGARLLAHVHDLPIRFHDGNQVGQIASRFGDVRASLGSLVGVLDTIVGTTPFLLIIPPLLFAIDGRLASIAFVSVVATVALTIASARVLRAAHRRAIEASAELTSHQVSVLAQVATTKALGVEAALVKESIALHTATASTSVSASALGAGFGFAHGLIRAVSMLYLSWVAWNMILADVISLGEFLSFSAYLGLLVGPVGQWVGLVQNLQHTAVAASRVFEYIDSVPEDVRRVERGRPARSTAPSLSFSGVEVVLESPESVLVFPDLAFPSGTVSVVMGTTGVGKTTLIRLAARFAEAGSGGVYVDGMSLNDMDLTDWRHSIAVMWQEYGLIRGSIVDNITFAPFPISRNVVSDVVEVCGLHDLCQRLPNGLNTRVGEGGVALSGGERQRIALARTLARRAPLVLLDEPTSQLDTKTEAEVLSRMRSWLSGTTVVMVTHRIPIAQFADRVYTFEGTSETRDPRRRIAANLVENGS